jgi:glycosyltransferase involved in cell wall biosynthesis
MRLRPGLLAALLTALASTASPAPLASLTWYAPFFSGGGYCSEATAFVEGLARGSLPLAALQHGDGVSAPYARGLPAPRSALLASLSSPASSAAAAAARTRVVVCHSEPGAWSVSRALPARYATAHACPPPPAADAGGRRVFAVGRTMFESDRLPEGWAARLNGLDEVWVPTDFAARIFAAGGVAPGRIVVVPEPVDAAGEFSPAAGAAAAAAHPVLPPRAAGVPPAARFLFVGKFERRKGLDVLLAAFATAFAAAPARAELFVLTSAYHSSGDFEAEVAREFRALACGAGEEEAGAAAAAAVSAGGGGARRLCLPPALAAAPPPVRLLSAVPQAALPGVFAGVDALVQPSRGEGWGRPHAEAMAMGVPVIATNWSGPTAFLTPENGFPLPFTHLAPVPEGPFKGHLMAEPDGRALAALLRAVAEDPAAARARGARARADMLAKFSLDAVAALVEGHVRRIAAAEQARDL